MNKDRRIETHAKEKETGIINWCEIRWINEAEKQRGVWRCVLCVCVCVVMSYHMCRPTRQFEVKFEGYLVAVESRIVEGRTISLIL